MAWIINNKFCDVNVLILIWFSVADSFSEPSPLYRGFTTYNEGIITNGKAPYHYKTTPISIKRTFYRRSLFTYSAGVVGEYSARIKGWISRKETPPSFPPEFDIISKPITFRFLRVCSIRLVRYVMSLKSLNNTLKTFRNGTLRPKRSSRRARFFI